MSINIWRTSDSRSTRCNGDEKRCDCVRLDSRELSFLLVRIREAAEEQAFEELRIGRQKLNMRLKKGIN